MQSFRHWDIDAVCIHEIGVISMRRQLDSVRHGFQRVRARGIGILTRFVSLKLVRSRCGDSSTPQDANSAKEMDESASDVVGYDVFPRPTDCEMPVDVASEEKAGYIVRLGAGVCCRRLRHGVPDVLMKLTTQPARKLCRCA